MSLQIETLESRHMAAGAFIEPTWVWSTIKSYRVFTADPLFNGITDIVSHVGEWGSARQNFENNGGSFDTRDGMQVRYSVPNEFEFHSGFSMLEPENAKCTNASWFEHNFDYDGYFVVTVNNTSQRGPNFHLTTEDVAIHAHYQHGLSSYHFKDEGKMQLEYIHECGEQADEQAVDLVFKFHYASDFNLDGIVDFSDFVILTEHYGEETWSPRAGNANLDNFINFDDFLILQSEFGKSTN